MPSVWSCQGRWYDDPNGLQFWHLLVFFNNMITVSDPLWRLAAAVSCPFIRGWQGHDEVGVLFRFLALYRIWQLRVTCTSRMISCMIWYMIEYLIELYWYDLIYQNSSAGSQQKMTPWWWGSFGSEHFSQWFGGRKLSSKRRDSRDSLEVGLVGLVSSPGERCLNKRWKTNSSDAILLNSQQKLGAVWTKKQKFVDLINEQWRFSFNGPYPSAIFVPTNTGL